MPEPTVRAAAVGLGWTIARAWRSERLRQAETIGRVYHRLNRPLPKPIPRIIDQCFAHFALNLAEMLRYPLVSEEWFRARWYFHGEEHLRKALAAGKGVILTVPHLGSWEFLGAAIAHRGYPMHSVYLEQKEGSLGAALDHFRLYSRITLHDRDRGGMGALKALKKGEILGMIPDQDGGNHGVYLDFLGHWVSLPAGPANWSLKTGCAVVPLYSLRRGLSSVFDAWFFPPLAPPAGDTHEERVVNRTRELAAFQESLILAHPEQYLWQYDRFKPRHHEHVAALKADGAEMRGGGAFYRHDSGPAAEEAAAKRKR